LAIAGWFWVAWQPSIYEATARVYVDSTSVLRPLLTNRIVPPDVATQLAYVRQALLGTAHLERVASENGLDRAVTTAAEREALLASLRGAILLTSRDNTNTVYTIGYRHTNRDTAISVVRTLLNSLVEDTLGANRQGTEAAERFLTERITEYERRLVEAEQALADFKKNNAGRLPGAQGGYFDRMQAEREGLDAARKDLRLAESRRDQLRAQLNSQPPVAAVDPELLNQVLPNSLDARIREYRAQLDRLLVDYTERHPDVVGTREALARLENQRAEQLRALGATDLGQEVSSLDANPVYQAIRIALNEAEVDIATRQADIQERARRLDTLRELVDEVPQVEAELARLNRDYEVVYEQYQGMVRSRETQDLSSKASDTEEVAFRVIDPPSSAFQPVAPKRLLLLTMVFAAALGGGGALCWLLAQLNPVFSSTTVLRQLGGWPVLGAVSEVRQAHHSLRRGFGVLAFGGAMAGLVALYGGSLLLEVAGSGIHHLVNPT
jgi:polysaccharide chain length determinant protein (PEP-CTERM system associated)